MSKSSNKRNFSEVWDFHADYKFDGSEDENSHPTNDRSEDENEATNESDEDRKDGDLQDQTKKWRDELILLDEKKHPEYLARLQCAEETYNNRKYRTQVLYDFRKEEIDEEYKKEMEASEKDLVQERQSIMDRLLSELNEKKRLLESEKNNVELTISGDVLELKPTVTRKLRRRGANDSGIGDLGNSCFFDGLGSTAAPLGLGVSGSGLDTLRGISAGGLTPVGGQPTGTERSSKKRKQLPPGSCTQINPLLNETDIYADLTKIQRACGKPASRKLIGVYTGGDAGGEERTGRSVWIDDGRLYYEHKCFQLGMQVMVDTRDGPSLKYSGTISAVGLQDVSVRRSSDMGVFKITIHQLRNGKYALHKRS